MNPINIICEYYEPGSKAYNILVRHGEDVACKAVAAAAKVPQLKPNLDFIRAAALLHDIGMFLTDTPELGCTGKHPYICHGYLGRELLEKKGLPKHALVCERHVGVGITAEDIKRHKLPLPARNMTPVSIEEQIVCFADKFFSKNGNLPAEETPLEDVLRTIEQYGPDKVATFKSWQQLFS